MKPEASTSNDEPAFADAFPFAERKFREFIEEFKQYGLEVHRGLTLKRGTGLLCYYGLKDKNIYLSLPDPKSSIGKLQVLFFRSILGCKNNEELFEFMELLLPRLIAHELGHYFRHKYNTFKNDLWYEEQVANQLATAVTKHRLTPSQKKRVIEFIKNALKNIEKEAPSKLVAVDSYHSPLHALNVSGSLPAKELESVQLMEKLFSISAIDVLKRSGRLETTCLDRLEQRKSVIKQFNKNYTSNTVTYFYYQLEWLLLDLESRENYYVDEFVKTQLQRKIPLLPEVQPASSPKEEHVLACFKAHVETTGLSKTASRYFYKRYRSLLLELLKNSRNHAKKQRVGRSPLNEQAFSILEVWDEKESDDLDFAIQLAPKPLQHLFPKKIGKSLKECVLTEKSLPHATDKRIWRHLMKKKKDEGAKNSINRLSLLDEIDIYRSLPADILLNFAHTMCKAKYRKGETLIWQGSTNDDILILVSGHLEVLVHQREKEKIIGEIRPGEVFGEMSFFTSQPRIATVRATRAPECFVLKASDLRLFAMKHPIVLMHMARGLALRLAASAKSQAAESA